MLIYSVIIYATMLAFGLVENIKGVSYTLIKAEFGVAYTQQGGLASFTSVSLLIVNRCSGCFEVGANAMATLVFTVKAALMMNLMHFFYGLGAI